MRIDINQKKISIGDKYTVFVEGKPEYRASSEFFRLLSVINLFRKDSETPLLTIRKQWFFMKPRYHIEKQGRQVSEFRADSWWNLEYHCYFGADQYHVYGHRGRKFSVCKNHTQVAWWEKEFVSWFDGDNYTITANSDCNVELVIAFCLILDNHHNKHQGRNGVSFDPGNIGGVVKPFDAYWRPK